MQLKDMILDLCAISAPSGFEGAAFTRVSQLLSPYVDEIKSDVMGNLIAVKRCGKAGAKKLMLDAHMDEIGMIVTDIDKTGFLRFANLGGIDPRMLPAREVRLLTSPPIHGVIDTMPPHALSSKDMEKALDPKKLFIDVGLSAEEAKRLIPLGTPVVFAGAGEAFGEHQLCSKSMDDRACVAIIIKVMENLAGKDLNADVYCLISTQEELGLRGATTGAYAINPDYALVLDVTHAKTPDSKKGETMELGAGAAIGVGPNMNKNITSALFELAKDLSIPHQTEVISGSSGTNGWAIQVSREGVCTAVVSLPLKYMHSPVETMDIRDAEAIVTLVSEFITTLDKEGM